MFRENEVKFNTILLIGDIEKELDTLMPSLNRKYELRCFESGDEAEASLIKQDQAGLDRIKIIVCDQSLAGMPGLDFLEHSVSQLPRAKRILLVDYPQLDLERINRAQLFRFLTKPYCMESLVSTIKKALLEVEMEQQPLHGDMEIVGQTPRFLQALELVRRLSHGRVPVLVRGETGTGKELIAHSLHCNGSGNDKPFVVVNCSALPETLFETEMFGHKKGAFTGAHQDRKGRVAQADGGTLFIDEVADIPLTMQTKLLRFLQFGEFQVVGDDCVGHATSRIVAATNRNLETMVNDGTFRRDLYYRLRVVEVVLPPLRERPSDISLLTGAFIKKYWPHKAEPVVTGHALKVLEAYDFPGNVRELENLIQRACLLARTEEIDLDALPPELIKKAMTNKPPEHRPHPENEMFLRLNKDELKKARRQAEKRAGFQVEKIFLQQLTARFETVTSAASHAGMQRTHLHSLLAKHGYTGRQRE